MRRFFTELFQPRLSLAYIACAMIRLLLTPNRAISPRHRVAGRQL